MKSTALSFRSLAAAMGTVAVLAGCSDTVGVVAGPTPVNSLFANYVALGNSITAGYQSGGINDSTQRESYAFLLAHAMNTRYAYASLKAPGCPPPVVNFQTQARLNGESSSYCAARNISSVTAVLNNVAVPGATSLDPTSVSTTSSNALTTFILGGKTQVQRAADAQPTFVSAWIGNNDALPAALSGILDSSAYSLGLTKETQFETNYRAMLQQLRAIPSLRGGVLIGVVQAGAAPILFPAQALFTQFKTGFDAAAGQTTTILPTCTQTTKSLISFQLAAAIRGGQHPPVISCESNTANVVGNLFVLDSAEQVRLGAAVTAYNTFIQAMADSLGWAYYDPNTTLNRLKNPTTGTPCINTVLDLTNATQPFGACVTLDGIHPSGRAHEEIVNDLMDAINSKYGTTLQHVTVQ